MTTRDLYAHLLKTLDQGERAAVISRYGADGSIDKRVAGSGDADAWRELEALLAQPGVVVSGPVASLSATDGSLVVVEHYSSKPRLVILGGGHIALALVEMGKLVDFEVLVYDDRPAFANAQRFPAADTVICESFDRFSAKVKPRQTDYLVIATRGHRHDFACLEAILAGQRPAYTGMLGSKRRVAIVMEQLREQGHDEGRLADIHAPIGLKIGALTPAEIAVSIMAELVATRRLEYADSVYNSCDLEVVEALAASQTADEAMITIYSTEGSAPIDTGAKLSMTYDGTITGTIGGGCSEAEAMQIARDVIREGGWRTHTVDMAHNAEEDGMVCGGEMHVVIERL